MPKRSTDQETSDMAVLVSLCLSAPNTHTHTHTHTHLCALSGYVCVLTILFLFVIKRVQTCSARPPRAVTQTPSSLTKKKKRVTSLNYIHPLGVSSCPKQTSEQSPPPPSTNRPQTSPRPYGKNALVNTLTLDGINLFSPARAYFH